MPDYVYHVAASLLIVGSVFWYRQMRETVRERFMKVARRRGGRVAKAPWILYPRLVVPMDRAEAQVCALYGSDSGSSARTFVWVGCGAYPDTTLTVRRLPGRVGFLERVGWTRAETGERAFDEVFWVKAKEEAAAHALLDEDVRRALLAFDERVAVTMRVGKTTAYRDGRRVPTEEQTRLEVSIRGIPAEVEDLERLLDVASLAHERLLGGTTLRMTA